MSTQLPKQASLNKEALSHYRRIMPPNKVRESCVEWGQSRFVLGAYNPPREASLGSGVDCRDTFVTYSFLCPSACPIC